MFDWGKFFSAFTDTYYTVLIMFVVEFVALIIAIIYGRRSKMGRVFIFYIAFDFSILTVDNVLPGFPKISRHSIKVFYEYTNTIIAAVELSVYYYFFHHVLPNKNNRTILISMAMLYGVLIIIYQFKGFYFFTKNLTYISYALGAVEFIFLLPFCLLFFHNLLNKPSSKKLFDRPSFWIVTGIFFYATISVPFYLIYSFIISEKELSELLKILNAMLFNIPFTLNFAFLIKAFLCKKPLTT